MRIIYNPEKKKILNKLEYYGITELPFLLIRFGKEKVRGYSGGLSREEIYEIDKSIKIDLMGLYLFHEYDDEIRLSLDALHILEDQITKNIIELNEEQAENWFKGKDVENTWKDEEIGFKVLKTKDYLIGCGKLTKERLINYMPKERRIKEK